MSCTGEALPRLRPCCFPFHSGRSRSLCNGGAAGLPLWGGPSEAVRSPYHQRSQSDFQR